MKRIKWFESIDSYINASDKIKKNQVSFTFDTKQSWFTENYISARYVINSNYDSGGGDVGSINTMDLIGTNVVGGREHYSRLIGSSNSNKPNINNKLQTYNEGGIDVSYSFNYDCECLNYVDDAFIIKERLNSLKFNVATDSYYYISVFAYNENISLEEYNDCNCTEFEFVFGDSINNGESYEGLFEIDENGQIYATQNGIDYMNQGISNGFKLVVLVCYDTIDSFGNFQMIINDETILNVSCVELNNYELQVLDYYETEIIDYISAIYINGQKQSEVMPYYYVTHTSNEFDVKIVFNTTNIPSMYAMFEYCDALTWVDFKHLTLDKGVLKDTSYMFSNCYSLIELKNLDKFDTSEVIDMRSMFQECYSIGCTNGKGLITNGNDGGGGGGPASVDNLGVMPLSYNIQTYTSMESDNNEVLSCEGSIINVVNNENCCQYDTDFSPSYDSYIPIKNINTNTKLIINDEFNINNDVAVCFCVNRGYVESSVNELTNSYDCDNIKNYFVLPLSSFTQISENELQINDNVLNEITYKLSNMYSDITHMTFMCANFECIATQPSSINNVNYCIFFPQECRISTSIYTECITCTFDLSKLNVSKVEYMSRMFQYCTNMSYINMSTWNTSNVTNMSYMFQGCESLIELNFSNWDMSNVYDSYNYFISNCYSLEFINLNCKMNPNGFTNNGSLYNIKEGGIIIVNEQYENYYPSYLFETLINEYGWNILSSQIDYQLTIIENGLEVTEGTVLCNGVELSYNSQTSKWEGNITLDNIDVIITYNNIEYVKPYNIKYLFIGDNNNSYSGFNITLQCYSFEGYAYFMNSAYTKYIDYMLVDGVETSPNYFIKSNEDFKSYEIKLIFNLSELTSIRGLFITYIDNEYDYDYPIVITSLTFENSFITTNIIDISNLCGSEFGLNVKLGDGFDMSNITCADYAFIGCIINISNLNLNNLVENGTYNDMFGWSYVIYDCENEAQKTIVESIEEVDVYCNNINYQLIIVENGLEITEGTVLCNNVELSYNTEISKWEGNITLDDFNVTILYNGIEHILYNKLGYLFIGNNNSSYEKINIIETCINNSNDYIKYIDDDVICEFVLLDGKQVNLLMEHMLYSNSININDNEEHIISLYVDTSNVTSMHGMFENCYRLTSIEFGDNFNTSNVTDMSSMFQYCSGLTSITFGNKFDTSNVTYMSDMFYNCESLTLLDLSNFDTSKVTDMQRMFQYCESLTSLDLSSFDISNVTSYNKMFYDLPLSGTLTYNCAYSDIWDNLLVTNSGSTYFPSGWTTTCKSSEVSVKVKLIENGLEITSGNIVVNNTTFTYNSEEQVWQGTYVAEQQSYPIYLNNDEIGTIKHGKLQYVFIGDNNGSYSGFSITETISVSNKNTSYRLIYNSFIPYIDAMLIDGEQVEISSEKTFNSIGEHTVKIIIDTSNVTDMSSMFYECSSLTSINFGDSFDTSNVTDMSFMFSYCYKLTSLDLSNLDTSKVTDMKRMFQYCESLTSLDLSNLDTSKVTDMGYMFNWCSGLTSLDLSSFDTSNVTDMGDMFSNCIKLTSITFGNKANVSNVTSYDSMFRNLPSNLVFNYDCNYDYSILLNYNNTYFKGYANCITKEQTWLVKLYDYTNNNELITDSSLNLTLSNGIQGVYDETQSGYTFTFTNVKDTSTYDVLINGEVIGQIRCNKFEKNILINIGNSYIKETVNVTSTTSTYKLMKGSYTSYMSEMFINGVKQDNIVSSYTFNEIGEHEVIYIVDSAQTLTSCSYMFEYCTILTSLDLSSFDTSNVTDMEWMFNSCDSLTSLDLSNFNTSNVTNMSYMFNNCKSLTPLNLSYFDTSKVTDMGYMFYCCSGLTSLDLSSFDTSNVTDMGDMFYKCSGLTSLDLSNFDTSKVTDMSYMFWCCSSLTSLDLSNFYTSAVTNMSNMFYNCSKLTFLDLSSFNTSKVTNMYAIFEGCNNLTSLDLSSFNTSNLTSMQSMFYNCNNLTSLDLSSFDTSKVTNMWGMFRDCSKLISITFGYKANVSKVTSYSYIFYNVPSTCTLTLCENTRNSWNKLISSYTLNVVENEC